MDGVLVDFAKGAAAALNESLLAGNKSHKNLKKLIEYSGPREDISGNYLDSLIVKKDAGTERTQWEKLVNYAMFTLIGKRGQSHWENLPPLIGIDQLIYAAIEAIGLDDVYVCTAPIIDRDGACERGKRKWIESNTAILPSNVFVTSDKGSIAAKFPNDTCILIDDREKYCTAWESRGGIAIRHAAPVTSKRVDNTIHQMKLIVNNESTKYHTSMEEL